MSLRIIATEIQGVVMIEPKVTRDERGFFVETYRADSYRAAGLTDFLQDNRARSAPGILRGLHAQWRRPQAKLLQVLQGRIYDVVVDVRKGSPTFRRWIATTMSADDFRQLYIPPGFVHGYFVLGDAPAEIAYRCSDYYDPDGELCIRWDDPELAIEWPSASPTLSPRDRAALTLAQQMDLLPTFGATLGCVS